MTRRKHDRTSARRRAPAPSGGAGAGPLERDADADAGRFVFAALELPIVVEEDGDEFQPIALIFLDPGSPHAFLPHLVREVTAEAVADAWEALVAELAAHDQSPPSRVRTADEALAAALREVGDGEPAVEVGATPEIDELREVMEEIARIGVPPSYFHGQALAPALVRELFAAARAFRRDAPWDVLAADEWISLDIPRFGIEDAAIALITDEGRGGLQIFPSMDVRGIFDGPRGEGDERLARRGTLALMFYARRQLPEGLKEELRRLPFAPATGPIPVLVACDDEGRSRPLTRRDYVIAIATLRAVTHFTHEYRDTLEAEECEAIDHDYRITVDGEALDLHLAVELEDAGTLGEGVEGVGPRPAVHSVHQLKVSLQGARPPIWRRLEVPSAITLAELHDVLQITMGWRNEHLHVFEQGGREIGPPGVDADYDERVTELWALVPAAGGELIYLYDFSDPWTLEIEVEEVALSPQDEPRPRCLDGRRAGPPEDGGGLWGLRDYLERGPEDEESVWYGFDARAFSVDAVNARLGQAFRRAQLAEAAPLRWDA